MPLYMPNPGADFALPPAGVHVAVCYRVLDLGTQATTYKGETQHKHLILIAWELPEERMDDGRPFTIAKRYTYSGHAKANLRKDLESWRGAPFTDADFGHFDIAKLLRAGCQLSVVHEDKDDKNYANITAIMRMPKGVKAPDPENECLTLTIQPGEFDPKTLAKLSDKLQEIVTRSPEYQALTRTTRAAADPGGRAMAQPDLDDEIPF